MYCLLSNNIFPSLLLLLRVGSRLLARILYSVPYQLRAICLLFQFRVDYFSGYMPKVASVQSNFRERQTLFCSHLRAISALEKHLREVVSQSVEGNFSARGASARDFLTVMRAISVIERHLREVVSQSFEGSFSGRGASARVCFTVIWRQFNW